MTDGVRVLEVSAGDLGSSGGALLAMREGDFEAIHVRGFVPADVSWTLRRRLEASLDGAPLLDLPSRSERNHLIAIGHPPAPTPLHPGGPPEPWYLDQAEACGRWVDGCFGEDLHWSEALEAVGAALQGGRPWRVLETERPWGRVSVRGFGEGAGFLPHSERMYVDIPIFDPIRQDLDLSRMLGFFMPLGAADGGGDLMIWRGVWQDGATDNGSLPQDLSAYPSRRIAVGPGDLLLHMAGPEVHEVLPVEGSARRWTVGGFGAWTHDGRELRYWA